MINIKITNDSQKRLYSEIENKINGSKEATSVKTRRELTNAIFSIASLEFIKTTNLRARSLKSSFHHVYEWNKVGQESGRLFRILKTNNPTGATIYYKFNNSNKVVPISPELKTPGNTGKYVKKSKIFKRKAEIMERGTPVSFASNKTIVFSEKGNLVFIPPGKTITIKNPGGSEAKGSFNSHFISWWMTKPLESASKSGIFIALEKSIAKALSRTGAGRSASSMAISQTLRKYELIGSVI